MRTLALLLMLTCLVTVPGSAIEPAGAPVSPDASVVPEQTLLGQGRIEGRVDIEDPRATVLQQPRGRTWTYFQQTLLHWGGTIVLLGMLAALVLGRVVLGRMRISAGRSGRKVLRFSAFERFAHWLTAVSFVLLALTGLNITFGKLLLRPLLGPDAFSNLAQAAKYVHNFVSFAFVLGLLLIVVQWFKDNIPDQVDVEWLKQGGGFVTSRPAPHAARFNAGEKMVYWLALLAGLAVIASGYLLLFPFYITNIAGMQVAHAVHAVVAILFMALILGHIYMGTFGMEGAMEAMNTGEVDYNWAKEHHDLWLAELERQPPVGPRSEPPPTPAR